MAVKKTILSKSTPVKKGPSKAEPVKKALVKEVKKTEPAKKSPAKAKEERNQKVSEQVRKAAKGGRSLASIWDKEADANNASSILPDGEHVVRINNLEVKDNPKKGIAAFLEVEAIDGDFNGKKGRQMYKLTDENSEKATGMDYLARDLALLGYEDVSGEELETTCETITSEQPMVVVRVRTNNGGYTNIFLQGLAEEGAGNGEGEGEASGEIEIGSRVTFDLDSNQVGAEVLKIDGSTARVKTDDGDKYDCDLSDLALEASEGEGEGEAAEIEVGSSVSFNDGDNDIQATVTKIKGGDYFVEDAAGDTYKVELSDLTISDGTERVEEALEVEVGSTVSWTEDDEEKQGTVTKIKGDKATIEDADGDKTLQDLSDLTVVVDAD